MKRLALRSDGYLTWIVKSFDDKRMYWEWVEVARQVLLDRESALKELQNSNENGQPISSNSSSSQAFAMGLRRCGERKELSEGLRLHADIVAAGFGMDSYVGNELLQMYGKCRSVDLARAVFEGMVNRDLCSWNMMMTAYAHNGYQRNAIEIFERMVKEGIQPDVFSYANMIGLYSCCQSLTDARKLFDGNPEIQQDRTCWTAMVSAYAKNGGESEAIHLFHKMYLEGRVMPNSVTYLSVLGACANMCKLEEGKKIHSRVEALGMLKDDLLMQTSLLNLYAKCGSVDAARDIFEKMQQKDTASWTAMIEAYVRYGLGFVAIWMYRRMDLEGVQLDLVAFVSVLGACGIEKAAAVGRAIHSRIITSGLPSNVVLETSLVCMYAKCGNVEDARWVFDRMCIKDAAAWNAMITAYAQHNCEREALDMYERMTREVGVTPDVVTFGTLLSVCSNIQVGKAIHARYMESGMQDDDDVDVALMNMYARCGSVTDAKQVFESVKSNKKKIKNVKVIWDKMITTYVRSGHFNEAVQLYNDFHLQPDKATFVGALVACASLGALTKGREIDARINMMGSDVLPDDVVETALITMYGKCGQMKDAQRIFNRMAAPQVCTWNAMIAAYGQHGEVKQALIYYKEMQLQGILPNSITLQCILLACSHGGLHSKASGIFFLFVSVVSDYAIQADSQHYQCIIDGLARGGRLREAEEVIDSMPCLPNAVGWKGLLGACAIHGDSQRGARAADCVNELDPLDSSQFVLLSNIYATH